MNLLRTPSLLGLILLAPAASAGTHFVDANLNTGSNDGTSWANAFQSNDGLQLALGVSASGDEIWVADGTYIPTQTGLRTDSFRMQDDVKIYGGFNGSESSLSQRVLGVTPSILSGDLAGNDNGGATTSENSNHVVRAAGANAAALLDGFTVRAGLANGSGNNNRGAGVIYGGGTTISISNCIFIDNRSTFGGGAGYINGAAPTFTDCKFVDNVGGSFGGAFDIATGGNIRFDRCSFSGNSANRAGALEIFATNGVVVTNCLFENNTATGTSGGGGMWMGSGGNTQVINCTFANNSATNQTAGGLRVQGASPLVANCVFWGNTGPGGAQNSANQISGTSNVTYSIVMGGMAGVGNLSVDPSFANAGSGDYSLSAGSPAIDAADNTKVPAGILLALGGGDRFVDDPTVADTGVGGAPIVDMGSYEVQAGGFMVTSYCFGDGSGPLACPCNNNGAAGAGCANGSFATGSTLTVLGTGSIANDSIVLRATESAPNRPGVFFQGNTQVNNGAGVVLGDGLRCAGGPIVRLEIVFANASGVAMSTVAVGSTGSAQVGNTKRYQWWYRDSAWATCNGGSNLSNGAEFTWIP